jgi:sigma-E factor negative regulatory protein RseA
MDDFDSISDAERMSAWMDGELYGDQCGHVLGEILEDAQSIETWHIYQVVGDVMRSSELVPKQGERAFWEKLEQRLLQEPQRPLAETHVDQSSDVTRPAPFDTSKPEANVSVFRWKMVAGVACSALLAVVGGGLWNQTHIGRSEEISMVKQALPLAPVVVAAESPVGLMLRDPRLEELMAAHRQLGGHSALQVPAGFLRNATYEGVSR